MSSLVSELKRRNVFRVAVLYGVVAWVIMQIADVVMPRVGIPEWGVTLVIILLILGFPIVAIAAWAFELTPEGIKRTREVDPNASITPATGQKINYLIIGVLAVALVFVVVDSYLLRDEPRPDEIEQAAEDDTPEVAPPAVVDPASQPALTSIAVLPFVNMSSDPEQEYFSDGLSEELLNLLAKIEDFKVAGRTSSFAFKGQNDDLRVIAAKLGVATILEGSVRKDGDQIRVTAQLIKADDGYHLWSETYDRKLESIFAIQDEIAGEVVTALKVALLDESEADAAGTNAALARERPTENMEAYTSYLRGQHLIKNRTGDDMFKALREFRHAVNLDPDFAEAHVGVANGYSLLVNYGYRNVEEVGPLAEASVERALALNPKLGSAWAAKNLLAEIRGAPIEEKLPLIEKAVALNPNDAQSLVWLASDYGDTNRFDEQFTALQSAYALDPLSAIVIFNYALVSKQRGLDEEAERLADELESLLPDQATPYRLRASLSWLDSDPEASARWFHRALTADLGSVTALVQLSELAKDFDHLEAAERYARRAREISPSSTEAIEDLGFALLFQGRNDEASNLVQQTLRLYPNDRLMLSLEADIAYHSGDYDAALRRLRKAYPDLFADPPRIEDGNSVWWAHNVAWIYRLRGEDDKADAMLAAVHNFVEPRMHVYPKNAPLWLASRTAAVQNDRSALERYLREFNDRGGALGRFVHDPMFLQYSDDPAIAAVLDEMREANRIAREKLVAEGVF